MASYAGGLGVAAAGLGPSGPPVTALIWAAAAAPPMTASSRLRVTAGAVRVAGESPLSTPVIPSPRRR
jgi:hypothetical protein